MSTTISHAEMIALGDMTSVRLIVEREGEWVKQIESGSH